MAPYNKLCEDVFNILNKQIKHSNREENMESYSAYVKERELDVKQLIFYLIDNIKWGLLIGIIFGILFGGFAYIKITKLDSEDVGRASIQDIVKKNRIRWNGIDSSVTGDSFNDPLPGTYIANTKVYVDLNYGNIEGNSNLDFTALNNKLQGDIVALAGNNESRKLVIDQLNLKSYGDMKDLSLDDLKYMTSCSFVGVNILQIQVADSDSERAVKIADSLANNLIDTASNYETVDDIRILEKASLSYSSPKASLSSRDYIKKTIKYGVFGGGLGVCLVFGVCFLLFVFCEKVRTKEDIEFLGLQDFGMIPVNKKRRNVELKRLIYNVTTLEKKNITVIPVDDTTSIDEVNENVLDDVKKEGYNLAFTDNIMYNPEVILEAKKSELVILAATYGKTLIKNLEFAKNELDKTGVEIAGVIVMDVKH